MKRLIVEALIIVAVAAIIGLIYNAISPKPLPLLPLSESEKKVADSLLVAGVTGADKSILNKTVTFEQVKRFLDDPNFIFIDSRRSEDYDLGKIGNAVNIYPYEEMDIYMEKLLSLPYDKTIIVYCDGGTCDLSHHVAEALIDFGYERVFLYEGGWEDWEKKN